MTAVQRHHTYLFAAGILLADWQAHGVVGVFRNDGHLHPTPVADADCWPVTDPQHRGAARRDRPPRRALPRVGAGLCDRRARDGRGGGEPLSDDEHRAIRVKALLDAERAAGYAECYRSAVARVLHGAESAIGARAITKREANTLRTTVAGIISDMERHVHGPLAETLKAEAVRDVEDKLVRLGRRK